MNRRLAVMALCLMLSTDAFARKRARFKVVEPEPPQKPLIEMPEDYADNTDRIAAWDEGQARRALGLDGTRREVGDFITVEIAETTVAELAAGTDLSRDASSSVGISALLGLETNITDANPSMGGGIGIETSTGSSFGADGGTTRGSAISTVLTCEVLARDPKTGNLYIWGFKQTKINAETSYVIFEGKLRPRDIRMNNRVSSEVIAEHRLEIRGNGVIAEKQTPGWLARTVDKYWPF